MDGMSSSAGWRQKPNSVVNRTQGVRGDLAGALSPAPQHLVQLGRVVKVGAHPLPQRRHEVNEYGGEVLFQIAITFALVGLLQFGDGTTRQRRGALDRPALGRRVAQALGDIFRRDRSVAAFRFRSSSHTGLRP